MLQDIRANSQGTIAKIIIGLIVISFSIFGIESLLFSGGSGGVAEVNGDEISAFALQQELSVTQRQLLAMLGENADPALLDQQRLSQQALETLIQRTVLRQATDELGLSASDAVLGEMIASMEQFQLDGQFSRDMYQSSLASAGFTPALFQARLAEDLQIGQLRAGLAGSDFSTNKELDLAAKIAYEGRDVRYITIPTLDFLVSAVVTEAEVADFYAANTPRFTTDEALTLEYIELKQQSYVEPIADQRLREEFELTREEFSVATESRVSHVLLEGDLDSVAPELGEVQAALTAGRDFAEVAQEFSSDVGSAQAGGDLGYTAGDAFPEEMELAISALELGEVSAPVVTDAGVHIIKLTDRREGSEVAYEDVVGELERRLQASDAGAALLRDVEALRDLVFNAGDLAEPASELGLEVLRSEAFTRADVPVALDDPRLLDAAYSDDVLVEGHNSEVVELDPEHFVVLRVAERAPPRVLSLEEVYGEIEVELQETKASELAAAAGEEIIAALETGTSVEEAANNAGFEWQVELGARRDSARIPQPVKRSLFALPAPAAEGPRRTLVDDSSDTVYVVELDRVTSGDLASVPAQDLRQLRDRVAGEAGGVLQQQIENAFRSDADINVF
ncbi:MAG: SurA N-terminal domain-containing protein [Pseudomonadota bacterium]